MAVAASRRAATRFRHTARARRAHGARARGAEAGRSRTLERGDRLRALPKRCDGQDARHARPGVAQAPRSRAGGRPWPTSPGSFPPGLSATTGTMRGSSRSPAEAPGSPARGARRRSRTRCHIRRQFGSTPGQQADVKPYEDVRVQFRSNALPKLSRNAARAAASTFSPKVAGSIPARPTGKTHAATTDRRRTAGPSRGACSSPKAALAGRQELTDELALAPYADDCWISLAQPG